LLSVLPVLVTWQACAVHGWTSGTAKPLATGTAAMAASLAVIHRPPPGVPRLPPPSGSGPGDGRLSLAYLLTASPLAAVGGHIILHTALVMRGTEMPPAPLRGPTWCASRY
jgi:hypothetical protein